MRLAVLITLMNFCYAKVALADEPHPKTAFEEALETRKDIFTKESFVVLNGRRFRKVEYGTQKYYLQILQEGSDATELTYLCGDPAASRFAGAPVDQISGSVRLTKRTRLFVEGLATICSGSQSRPLLSIVPALRIGFAIDDEPVSKALIKEKKIYIKPGSLGFSGTW